MRYRVAALCCVLAFTLTAKKKNGVDDKTQKLEEPKDPPAVVSGDAERLLFHVSPLSAKGLLSQQTRDALTAILKANNGATIIHLRALVAGNGDLRRIPQIVSDVFGKKHAPLPSLSLIQIGALPLDGAQILIEAVSESRKPANPSGIAFVAAQDSVDHLAGKIGSAAALAVTCFVSDIGKAGDLSEALSAKYPRAAIAVVQTQRLPPRPVTACEAIVNNGHSGQLAFTGTQSAFGFEEKDAGLAFQRIGKELSAAGLSPSDALFTHIYALTKPIADMALKSRPPAGEVSQIPVEGVASSDASFAADVIAAKH